MLDTQVMTAYKAGKFGKNCHLANGYNSGFVNEITQANLRTYDRELYMP